MLIRILLLVFLLLPGNSLAAETPPSDIGLPPAPKGAAQSDCEQVLQDWGFAEHKVVSQDKKYIFLMIDRYGGKREFSDFRGTMCRISDMKELWAVEKTFFSEYTLAFSEDGKYFVNAVGRVFCKPETYQEVLDLGALVFHKNGTIIKEYKIDELYPDWQKTCEDDGVLRWLSTYYGMLEDSKMESNKYFMLKTGDGTEHYFLLENGQKLEGKPQDLIDAENTAKAAEEENEKGKKGGFSFF
ncbi:MAG: hypothetical protein GC136_03495 [Alphaproteobacteria bacterium]|nr:hypothetical protein [Alphaproteobacteria bacterium]